MHTKTYMFLILFLCVASNPKYDVLAIVNIIGNEVFIWGTAAVFACACVRHPLIRYLVTTGTTTQEVEIHQGGEVCYMLDGIENFALISHDDFWSSRESYLAIEKI